MERLQEASKHSLMLHMFDAGKRFGSLCMITGDADTTGVSIAVSSPQVSKMQAEISYRSIELGSDKAVFRVKAMKNLPQETSNKPKEMRENHIAFGLWQLMKNVNLLCPFFV